MVKSKLLLLVPLCLLLQERKDSPLSQSVPRPNKCDAAGSASAVSAAAETENTRNHQAPGGAPGYYYYYYYYYYYSTTTHPEFR